MERFITVMLRLSDMLTTSQERGKFRFETDHYSSFSGCRR